MTVPQPRPTRAGDTSAEYLLIGDFDPDDVSAQTGITPAGAHRKGDIMIHGHRLWPNSDWQLESQLDPSEPLDAHLRSLLAQMRPGWDAFVRLGREYEAHIECPAYLSDDTSIALIFERDIVRQVAELNAGVGFDWYWKGYDAGQVAELLAAEAAARPPALVSGLEVILVARFPDLGGASRDEAVERGARLHRHVETAAARAHGSVIERRADQVSLVFGRIHDAERAALVVSAPPPWPAPRSNDRAVVGMAIGEAAVVDGLYVHEAVRLAEALAGLAGPGEILASAGVAEVMHSQSFPFVPRGRAALPGFQEPVEVVQIMRSNPAQRQGSSE